MQNNKYKEFYQYTDTDSNIKMVADELKSKLKSSDDEVRAAILACHYINSIFWDRNYAPPRPINRPRTLLESRFKKASEILKKPQASCGSAATLAASILRTAGYTVKLIHGELPNTDQHAWNEIWVSKREEWCSFDCSGGKGENYGLTGNHKKITECADWSELKDLLLEEHNRNQTKSG